MPEADDPALLHAQRVMLMGAVASGYIHDLNNLLTVVIGATSLIEADLPPDHPANEGLADIQLASRSASNIARRMLSFVRRQPITCRPVNLCCLIEDYLSLAARLVGRSVVISTELAPELWQINADPVLIEQILLNLLTNARNAMPNGGRVRIKAVNHTSTADCGVAEFVRLSVSDTGMGMSAQVRERLFEPFFSTSEAGGVGLGLATCHYIVSQLGGIIDVQSEPGAGTTFHLYLPRLVREEPGLLQRAA